MLIPQDSETNSLALCFSILLVISNEKAFIYIAEGAKTVILNFLVMSGTWHWNRSFLHLLGPKIFLIYLSNFLNSNFSKKKTTVRGNISIPVYLLCWLCARKLQDLSITSSVTKIKSLVSLINRTVARCSSEWVHFSISRNREAKSGMFNALKDQTWYFYLADASHARV